MDRNTLLAFFLIAIVLIFTPKYMEIVSPETNREILPSSTDNQEYKTPPPQSLSKKQGDSPEQNNSTTKNKTLTTLDEETILIENELFEATLSSVSGGTFKSFNLKNYYKQDSVRVNLLDGLDLNNLALFIKDLDGNDLSLNKPWLLDSKNRQKTISQKTSFSFSFELYPGKKIYKTLTFTPDSYVVDIDLNFDEVKKDIYRDFEVGWYGGLAATEVDIAGDQTYFKSYVYAGGELEDQKVKSGKNEEETYNGSSDWVAIRTKYFISAFIPKESALVEKTTLSSSFDSLETYNASFLVETNQPSSFSLYLGPLEYDRINELDVNLDVVMDFGWSFIRPISKGVLYFLKAIHGYVPNYGVVLIIFSFVIKLIVYPLTKKSYQSTAAMQTIQPEINGLKDKYKNNPQKLNQATMQLYKKKGVNPLGGCLPMFLQMPLLFALFQVFRTTIELRSEPFIWWIKDLSAPDTVIHLPFTIPIYGDQVSVLPIFMVISMFIQQRMMAPSVQQPQQKTMQYFMTGFFFLMFNSFPSGLNLYYTLFNILTIAQQKLIPPAIPNTTPKEKLKVGP